MKTKVRLAAYITLICALTALPVSVYADSSTIVKPAGQQAYNAGNIVPSYSSNTGILSLSTPCPDNPICPDINGIYPSTAPQDPQARKLGCPDACFVRRVLTINGVTWYSSTEPATQPFGPGNPITSIAIVKQPICPAGYALEGMDNADWNVEDNQTIKYMPFPILGLGTLKSYLERGYQCTTMPASPPFPESDYFQWTNNSSYGQHTYCSSNCPQGPLSWWTGYWDYPGTYEGMQNTDGSMIFLIDGAAGAFSSPTWTIYSAGSQSSPVPCDPGSGTSCTNGSGLINQCGMTYNPRDNNQFIIGVYCSQQSVMSATVNPRFNKYMCYEPTGMQFSNNKLPTKAICARITHTWQKSGTPYKSGQPITNIGDPETTSP